MFPSYLILRLLIILSTLMTVGTVGYLLIEKLSFLDALFMSVQTLTTVGYGTIKPLSDAGKIFTIIYILFGVILFLYIAAEFANSVVNVNLQKILGRKKMENKLKNLKNHLILCGYGRTGLEIASQLKNNKLHYVVIDKDLSLEETALEEEFLFIPGDATDDHILQRAGIERARGIFCALNDDVDNLYLTLSAKNLNQDLKIVTRCVKASNEPKFRKAGATTIILPYEISGKRMVSSIIKPDVVDFLDVVMHSQGEDLELKMEQFLVPKDCCLENKTIYSSEIRQKSGVIIVAIKRGGKFITNPESDTVLKAHDYLITLGTTQQLQNFENFVK
ncbi:MAG TPA: potassium channel protein [Cyanobacteria bacterium UBA9971]|nr:potassium channel protein [Cyanobacteria bacterium UBA9971]